MKIKDLYGKDITVTDLEDAIEQAGIFKEYQHRNASPEQAKSDKERKAYWTDIHEKLLQLQPNTKTKILKNDN